MSRKSLDICRADFGRIQDAEFSAYPQRYVEDSATQKPGESGSARREGSPLADFRRTLSRHTTEGMPSPSFTKNQLKSEPSNVKGFMKHYTSHLSILMYHKIGYPKPGQRYRNLSVNPRKFARQMRWLKDRGYQTVAFSQLMHPAFCPPPKSVLLTFDDGYVNFYTAAYPVLEVLGFTACVYVVVGLVGKTNQWSQERNDVEESLLTWPQIQELQNRGIEFGSHAMTHQELTNDAPDILNREIRQSKQVLEDKLGRSVLSFAWPGGIGADSIEQKRFVAQCGYGFACRASGGIETFPLQDPMALRRIAIGEKHFLLSFAWKTGTLC